MINQIHSENEDTQSNTKDEYRLDLERKRNDELLKYAASLLKPPPPPSSSQPPQPSTLESLKFPNEFNCKLSGTEILYKLNQAAKDGKLERIVLKDMSEIVIKNIGKLTNVRIND
jgi:hypothetical protein